MPFLHKRKEGSYRLKYIQAFLTQKVNPKKLFLQFVYYWLSLFRWMFFVPCDDWRYCCLWKFNATLKFLNRHLITRFQYSPYFTLYSKITVNVKSKLSYIILVKFSWLILFLDHISITLLFHVVTVVHFLYSCNFLKDSKPLSKHALWLRANIFYDTEQNHSWHLYKQWFIYMQMLKVDRGNIKIQNAE